MSENEYLLLRQFKETKYIPNEVMHKLNAHSVSEMQKRGLIKFISTSTVMITNFAISEIEEYERTIQAHKAKLQDTEMAKEALKKSKISNILAFCSIVISLISIIITIIFATGK